MFAQTEPSKTDGPTVDREAAELQRWEDDGGSIHADAREPASSLNQNIDNPSRPTDGVYGAIATHQTRQEWQFQPLFLELQRWREILDSEFALGLCEVVLSVDWLRYTSLGQFRCGHNGMGLVGEITINRRHLENREFWRVLGTLFHELLHAWQQIYGQPGKWNYHNVEFRDKAASYGLIVDERGHTQYSPESPFMELLKKHGVNVPSLPSVAIIARRGSSKLKLWSCGCTKVRVAVADFRARCLKPSCGNQFTLRE
jgi:hypothetical protein